MEIIDIELFNQNLLVTQVYCDAQLQNEGEHTAGALRTINKYNNEELFSYELQPESQHFKSFFSVKWSKDPIFSQDKIEYPDLFDAQMAYKKAAVYEQISAVKFSGKILIAEIDMTVVDGASEAVSEGLIDLNDCPPIDTWFYLTRNEHSALLFAWIPEPFINLADEAIEVNCVDCLYWYKGVEF